MLEQLMVAQAQECIFKGLLLPASATPDIGPDLLQLAQEAAQVTSRSPAQKLPTSWPSGGHSKSEEQSSGGQEES